MALSGDAISAQPGPHCATMPLSSGGVVEAIAVAGTLAGTIVGIIGAIVVERIRTSDAKKAREEVRQQERDDFQRTTLLELQEVLGQYVRAVGKVRVHDERAKAATGQWHRTQLPADVSSKAFESGRRARQFVLRVRDDCHRSGKTDQQRSG